jgi:hypothetical protein
MILRGGWFQSAQCPLSKLLRGGMNHPTMQFAISTVDIARFDEEARQLEQGAV